MINPFSGDGFTLAALTASIDRLPFVPGRIGAMGLFSNEGVSTPAIIIEERDNELVLVPNTRRGAPAVTKPGEQRKLRTFACTHLPIKDYVHADDLYGMREFGSEDAQESLANRVNGKLTKMKQSLAVTLEWMRMGALKGTIVDGAGTTVYNLYTEFGIPAPSAFDFLLGTGTTSIRGKCNDVIERISNAMNGTPFDHVHAFCGASFFKRMSDHADVKDMLKWASPQRNVDNVWARGSYEYGGIVFEPYRGQVGGTPFVPPTGCVFFPVGSPGIFVTYFAPSTWIESVGTAGVPMYAKQIPTPDNSGIELLAQSNPLPLCVRPAVLQTGTTSN